MERAPIPRSELTGEEWTSLHGEVLHMGEGSSGSDSEGLERGDV